MKVSLKFIYSEEASKFCKISTVDLSYVVSVIFTMEISQSTYMNLKNLVNTLAEELVKNFRTEFIPIWLLAQLRFALLVARPTQFDPLMMAEK